METTTVKVYCTKAEVDYLINVHKIKNHLIIIYEVNGMHYQYAVEMDAIMYLNLLTKCPIYFEECNTFEVSIVNDL